MTISNSYDFNVSSLKPKTVTTFKHIYTDKKDLLEYLSKFGNDFNKAATSLILTIGGVRV